MNPSPPSRAEVGLSHHRWIVDVRVSGVLFAPKHHVAHGDRSPSIPAAAGGPLPEVRPVSWLPREGEFTYGEGDLSGDDIAATVRAYRRPASRGAAVAAGIGG